MGEAYKGYFVNSSAMPEDLAQHLIEDSGLAKFCSGSIVPIVGAAEIVVSSVYVESKGLSFREDETLIVNTNTDIERVRKFAQNIAAQYGQMPDGVFN